MTLIHQNNLDTELFFILDLKMFKLEMRRIRSSNLFHSVGAAKLKIIQRKYWNNLFSVHGGITNNKSSLAECVFVELHLTTISDDALSQLNGAPYQLHDALCHLVKA